MLMLLMMLLMLLMLLLLLLLLLMMFVLLSVCYVFTFKTRYILTSVFFSLTWCKVKKKSYCMSHYKQAVIREILTCICKVYSYYDRIIGSKCSMFIFYSFLLWEQAHKNY